MTITEAEFKFIDDKKWIKIMCIAGGRWFVWTTVNMWNKVCIQLFLNYITSCMQLHDKNKSDDIFTRQDHERNEE